MTHPFGNLLRQHLSRTLGINQNRLAELTNLDPAVISHMCKGKRLSGPLARERVINIIQALHQMDVLTTMNEANKLLSAASMTPLGLDSSSDAESKLISLISVRESELQATANDSLTSESHRTPEKSVLKSSSQALGYALRRLREDRKLSRAELLDRLYTELEQGGINYQVKGDWWLSDIENGEKTKMLPREYIDAFIRALGCTKLEAIELLVLADINILARDEHNPHVTGLSYVLAEVFGNALEVLKSLINEDVAQELNEREWIVIGTLVLETAIQDLQSRNSVN